MPSEELSVNPIQMLFISKIKFPDLNNHSYVLIQKACHHWTGIFSWKMTNFLCLSKPAILQGNDNAQNALQQEWGNFPFANLNGICWGLPLQLVQLIRIHFLPHLESFMWERKFKKNIFKKSPIQPPNGVLLIFKLPFPNGSYRNGVCRALWAYL